MKKERRSLKEVVKANKHAIILGTTLTVTTVAFICGLKIYIDGQNDIKELLLEGFKAQKEYDRLTTNMYEETTDKIQTLYEAASEGLFEEAIATCTRKLNKRIDTISRLEKIEDLNQQGVEKLMKAKMEAGIFKERIDKFTQAQKLWGIED